MTEIIGKVKTHTTTYKSRCYLCAGVIDALAPHTLTHLECGDIFRNNDDEEAWDMWSVHSHHACEVLLDLAPDIIPEDDDGAYERPYQDLVYIYLLDTLQDPRALLERVEDEHHRAWLLARYERLIALASGQMNLF